MLHNIGLILAGCLISVGAGAADIYTWVDDQGRPHYSDKPKDDQAVVMHIESRPTDLARIAAQNQERSELSRERRERLAQEEEFGAEEERNRNEVTAQREANCAQARQRLETYLTSRRLYKPLPDGEREWLSDAEIDAARADARRTVDEWCD